MVGGGSGEAISHPVPGALGSAAARRLRGPVKYHLLPDTPIGRRLGGRKKKKTKNVPAEQVLPLPPAKRLLGEMRMRIRICIRWALARWGTASGHIEARRAGVSFLPKEFLNPGAYYCRGCQLQPPCLNPQYRPRQLATTKTVC